MEQVNESKDKKIAKQKEYAMMETLNNYKAKKIFETKPYSKTNYSEEEHERDKV